MKYWLGKMYLWLVGWKMVGERPRLKKYVIIAAPHTSNWDVPLMLSLAYVYGIPVSWVGKHTLFRPPLGWLIRLLGGVPVDRRARHNAVQQMVDEFARRESFYLLITPEGTRGRTEYWKSGFYHIARGAGVPLVLGKLDFKRKLGGLVDVVDLTGDIKADMDRLRAFYHDVEGKYPNDFGPVRLREESAVETD